MSQPKAGGKVHPRVRRVGLLGYPAVGKSSLAYQFVEKRFDDEYCTTINNHLVREMKVSGKHYEIHLYDTMGVTELPNFSDEQMTRDGWILVYSVVNRRSFQVVQEIYDKIRVNVQSPALMVVGNKTDLLPTSREVTTKEGKELAESLNAGFIESSAKVDDNVQNIFEQIIRVIEKDAPKDKECVLL